jgi:chemotaxis protein methyltransferase CheR
MREAVSHATRFQHVVFPDSVGGYGRTVDLAPPPPARACGTDGPTATRPMPLSQPMPLEAESFIRWLLSRAGLSFRHYKHETLERRLPACLRALRVASPAQARAAVQRNPHLAWPALDALLIGVTGFFRDDAVFATLARQTLPDLLERWRNCRPERPFRVWSAGCSDGAELYSVAMLLVENGALTPGSVELLGTDCRPEALARAAAGVCDAAAVKGVPPPLLRRYFRFDGEHYHVQRAVRAAAVWRRADALAAGEAGPWDLVLCRNLAIYLQPDATASLWATLAAAVRPGGALVLGKAERPVGVAGLLPDGPCVYRRVPADSGAGA